MMFITIIRHIEANVRHQPLKMSSVLFEPPSPNASGAIRTRTAVTTYRSATSKHSFTNCHITTKPTMIISSQDAPILKLLSSGMFMVTLLGIWSICMICAEIFSPISQICWLTRRRKANTKVRVNRSLGSSPSKPRPEIMDRTAWNTRFPIRSAQPAAIRMERMSFATGAT